MRFRTRQNVINQVIGTSPVEILGPNPSRKAFLITPVSPTLITTPVLTKQSFTPGLGQAWTVPLGVTAIVDAYCFGAGGRSGIAGLVLGAGGGGGGGFASAGPVAVVGGTTYTANVDQQGGAQFSSLVSPAAVVLARANSGANGVLDIHGAGGTAPTGNQKFSGGDGDDATGLGGAGGGGGGCAGSFAVGAAAVGSVHGNGGGAATLLAIGNGGAGGDGGGAGAGGVAGVFRGGGSGGGGSNSAGVANGGDGAVSIFWFPPATGTSISMSHRQDVVVGVGSLNWTFDVVFPFYLCDNEIGDAIGLPWWIVASQASTSIQITEYSYEDLKDAGIGV